MALLPTVCQSLWSVFQQSYNAAAAAIMRAVHWDESCCGSLMMPCIMTVLFLLQSSIQFTGVYMYWHAGSIHPSISCVQTHRALCHRRFEQEPLCTPIPRIYDVLFVASRGRAGGGGRGPACTKYKYSNMFKNFLSLTTHTLLFCQH